MIFWAIRQGGIFDLSSKVLNEISKIGLRLIQERNHF